MEPDRSWGETLEKAQAHGKFVRTGQRKLSLRGVTYETFRRGDDGCQYPAPSTVATDFAAMRAHGINAARTYSVPPRWLLDLAEEAGLFILVGVAWEQHVTFLSERDRMRSIADRVRIGVRECAGHPAVLAYAIGNEIPASIVRWHGRRRIEKFLEELYRVATEEDPDTLVTYVNYPSTEYLQLPFLDLVCFNVFLEAEEKFEAYLARLQSLAGNRPLVITELGLDGLRNGDEAQADSLAWQLSTAFAAGCAGAFVFAWTDEWNRGGADIDDWRFGLTRADRSPKPALAAVEEAFASAPLRHDLDWPRISVVVCTYNGEATIAECLEGCTALDYPNFEVLVINDGSTDRTAELAADFDVRVISTQNRGLAAARNVGLRHASGEIVAYLDDDASPDSDWLRYLAAGLMTTPHAAIGGPNVPPVDGFLADCIAKAPGGPIHVLVSDREAEHIPGCNMAFRREVLEELGASTRVSGLRATTSTSAGGSRTRVGQSASLRQRWCATAVASRFVPTRGSNANMARPRRFSSANGRSATTAVATCAGRATSTGGRRSGRSAAAGGVSITEPGEAGSSSRSTSAHPARSPRCPSCRSGIS
jgi:hypothetical protein